MKVVLVKKTVSLTASHVIFFNKCLDNGFKAEMTHFEKNFKAIKSYIKEGFIRDKVNWNDDEQLEKLGGIDMFFVDVRIMADILDYMQENEDDIVKNYFIETAKEFEELKKETERFYTEWNKKD